MMYQRGDIVWLEFPFSDLTDIGFRPALVLSNENVNVTGDYILVQITSRIKGDGLSMALTQGDFSEATLPKQSYVRIHKLFTANETLITIRETAVTDDFMMSVVNKLNHLIS